MKVVRSFFSLSPLVALLLAVGIPATSGQDGTNITVALELYEGNPVLTPGEEGEWDAAGVFEPRVIYSDGVFHMFYQGANATWDVSAVGYATSEDGMTWTKYEGNPVFAPDVSIAPHGVSGSVTILDGETWVMYFVPRVELEGSAYFMLRATASVPTGPWTVDRDPVLEADDVTDWDFGGAYVQSVVRTADGYALYTDAHYILSIYYVLPAKGIGLATSPDGITWTKYDNPETTRAMYDASDPVFKPSNVQSWDRNAVGTPCVLRAGDGWEMFYAGFRYGRWSQIGYATSQDGITWTRNGEEPVLKSDDAHLPCGSVVVVDGTYYLYHMIQRGTGTEEAEFTIGLATGTVTR
jgi:predicted GH43/DUF377 family glycosyl hydrolase